MELSGCDLESLREEDGLALYRTRIPGREGTSLVLTPIGHDPAGRLVGRLEREFAIRDALDQQWAVRPQALVVLNGRRALVLDDPSGERLDSATGRPFGLRRFLSVAARLADALHQVHARGLIHRDLRPANIILDADGRVLLTGFGRASRLVREWHLAEQPAVSGAALPYIAPEQSGRTNRSIDHRSDLYSLGVTLYELLTGTLPFAGSTPTEWVYNHVARRPPPPRVRVDGIPRVLDQIILKLLEKNAEDRYQTSAGLRQDLLRCLAALESERGPGAFALGARDVPNRLLLPERLYGREKDVGLLRQAFDSVASHGGFEFLLVSGESGIGKSAVVGELRTAIYAAGGMFASGKFDQLKRNVPYSTLVEALRGLFRQILGMDDLALAEWRRALSGALGSSGELMTELFPELELIVGRQPPVPAVPPAEAKNRVHLVLMRLIGAFAGPGRPLVLFLDDLQWLDDGTRELLELMGGDAQLPHLLLIGAYRDDEVGPDHKLARLIADISEMRGGVEQVSLKPLRRQEVAQLVRDALHAPPAAVDPLAELVFEKARGNPFFTRQFLDSLSAEALIRFNPASGVWEWELDQVRRRAVTDNVANMVAGRLGRHRGAALGVLQVLACLGVPGSSSLLGSLLGASDADIDLLMRDVVADGLVHRVDQGYLFAHDHIRATTYALIPAARRDAMHLEIGRQLLSEKRDGDLGEAIFTVVDHMNRGREGVDGPAERGRLAALNLQAGRRAKASAAYAPGLDYLEVGRAILGDAAWEEDYRLVFDLEFDRADCWFMLGETERAESAFADLARRAVGFADLRAVVERQISLYSYLGNFAQAVTLGLGCLSTVGEGMPEHPTLDEIEAEYRRFVAGLEGREPAEICDLPRMEDGLQRDVMRALADLFPPAGASNIDLHHLAALRIANLTLRHGLADETPHAFACIAGQVLGWRFGSFEEARELGRITLSLVEDRGYDRYVSRVYAVFSGNIGPWSRPLSECYALAVRATEIGREQGGITYSGYAWSCALTALLDSGRDLAEVERQAESSLAILRKLKFPLVIDFVTTQLMLARALRGATSSLATLNCDGFDAEAFEGRLADAPDLWHALVRHRIRRLQLAFIAGDLAQCLELLRWLEDQVEPLKVFELAEYHFYAALARAAALTEAEEPRAEGHWAMLAASCEKLARWRALCPANFDSRAELVLAEVARLEGRIADAELHYEAAIASASRDGFQQNHALANELAGRFYAGRAIHTAACAYARAARDSYASWGAAGKVRQLDGAATGGGAVAGAEPGRAIAEEGLDFAAAVGLYQALSSELVLDDLIDRLMTMVLEHAGAARGLLLLSREGRLRIVAEAKADHDEVTVSARKPAHFAGELPESVLNYVYRTHELIIIDDATRANAHSGDPYILRARPRSVLCLPLLKQARLVGVLYLENDLTSHSFTTERVALLQLVASQAAILIENAELFQDVQRTQAEARRAGDEVRGSFDMIPALAWRASPDGTFEFSNRQWHDYTGIPEERARGQSWIQAFHPHDRDRVEEQWRQLLAFRASGEFEARMRRSDGNYRRFLVRLTPMRDGRGEILAWHGTNTDIDDLKRAEEAQEALARASRVTAMGALTVSIAHEVNQPLMAIVTNAASCLRWLRADPPNLPEACLAADRVVRDGHRAGDVIASIRALARNAGPEVGPLSIREVALEVLQLTRNEVGRQGIAVDTRFARKAGPALGDRVQVQQVVLNLVMNAIEAMENVEGTRRLRISSRAVEPGFLNVSVSDTGVGLSPTDHDRIFEAFFTTKREGVGIGLSICRTIIESHGGRLWAEPNRPRGSCFSFSIPLAIGAGAHAS